MKFRKKVRKVFGRISGASRRNDRAIPLMLPATRGDNTNATSAAFTQEILGMHEIAASRHSVKADIHPADFIYWFAVEHSPDQFASTPVNAYFDGGSISAHKLVGIINSLVAPAEERVRVLEFASGYGRLTRHLKRYPQIDLVCSDIHEEAISFLSNSIGVKAFVSHAEPEAFSPPDKYDITFAFSFFTHMPKTTFGPWLESLYQTLNPGGRLIFTTHGYPHIAKFPGIEIPSDGFFFSEGSEQKDLDGQEYGVSLTEPRYVFAEIAQRTGSDHIVYKQANWDSHDLWIVQRT